MLTGCATIEGDIPTPSPFVQTFKTITYGCQLDLAAMPTACIGTSNDSDRNFDIVTSFGRAVILHRRRVGRIQNWPIRILPNDLAH